jgi:hypothetical protein
VRKIIASTVSILALAISSTAFAQAAQTKKEAAYKIQYDVPANMKATTQGNITALDEPKNEIAFFIELSDETDPAKAMGGLDAVTSKVLKNVKNAGGAPQKSQHNGMDAVKMIATGNLIEGGKPVKIAILLLKSPSGKYVGVVGIVDAAKEKDWQDTFMKVMSSFKPAS